MSRSCTQLHALMSSDFIDKLLRHRPPPSTRVRDPTAVGACHFYSHCVILGGFRARADAPSNAVGSVESPRTTRERFHIQTAPARVQPDRRQPTAAVCRCARACGRKPGWRTSSQPPQHLRSGGFPTPPTLSAPGLAVVTHESLAAARPTITRSGHWPHHAELAHANCMPHKLL